jgi:hypothetical protein
MPAAQDMTAITPLRDSGHFEPPAMESGRPIIIKGLPQDIAGGRLAKS